MSEPNSSSVTDGGRARLLVVAPSAELYGADRVLLSVLHGLAVNFDVTVCFPSGGPLLTHVRAIGLDVIVLPDYCIRRRHLRPTAIVPWLARAIRACWRLHRTHRGRRFDLIYSGTLASGVGSPLALLWRVPHVQHVHEVPYHGIVLRQVLLRWVRRTADALVCNSHYVRNELTRAVPALRDRSTVVPNGVSPVDRRAPTTSETGCLQVVCVARFNRWKGQSVLVEAARLAHDRGHRWRLHFFGDSLPEDHHREAELRRQVANAGLASSTTFHGFVEDQEAVFAEADIVVIPSTSPEPFGMAALEAQVRGIPVVATTPGGPAEILRPGETGLLVPIGDAAALCEAVARLEDADLRYEMGRRAELRASTHFQVSTMVDGVAAEIERALRGAGR